MPSVKIKEAFALFDLDPVSYFKPCFSQVEACSTLNFIKEIIKRVYKKKALKYHPDSNSGTGNPGLFAKFTEAKSVLLDLEIKPVIKDPTGLSSIFEEINSTLTGKADNSWRAWWDMEKDIKTYKGTWTYTGNY
jgi:hypothetical protein